MKKVIVILLNIVGLAIGLMSLLVMAVSVLTGLSFLLLGLLLLSPVRNKLFCIINARTLRKKLLLMAGGVTVYFVVFLIGILTFPVCEHEWMKATCTEPKTCELCGETEGEALGHNVSEWTTSKKATCTKEGEKKGKCLTCKEDISKKIPKKKHNMEWEVTQNSTCTEEGKKVGKCLTCQGEITKKIPKKKHNLEWIITKKATCKNEGEEQQKCKGCGLVAKTKSIEKKKHKMEDYEFYVESEATLTSSGVIAYPCIYCGTVVKREEFNLTLDEFKSSCERISYEELARYPDAYNGSYVVVSGRVGSVYKNSFSLATSLLYGVAYDNYVWVDYDYSVNNKQILRDDYVVCYGVANGLKSFSNGYVPVIKGVVVEY